MGDELVYDTFEAEVWDYAYALLMLADSGPSFAVMNADGRFMLSRLSSKPVDSFTYGAPVTWTHRGKLMLRQYLESVKRTGKYKYLLSCVSGIGLIAKSRHYGGLYENVPFWRTSSAGCFLIPLTPLWHPSTSTAGCRWITAGTICGNC